MQIRHGYNAQARVSYETAKKYNQNMKILQLTKMIFCGLGSSNFLLGQYDAALSYFYDAYNTAINLRDEKETRTAGLNVAITLGHIVHEKIQKGGEDESELQKLMKDAKRWYETVDPTNNTVVLLHFARFLYRIGDVKLALEKLSNYCCASVETGNEHCAGCHQEKIHGVKMLVCSHCRIARFCNAEHQKVSSSTSGWYSLISHIKHKDVCALLGLWRLHVMKEAKSPDLLRDHLLGFLARVYSF